MKDLIGILLAFPLFAILILIGVDCWSTRNEIKFRHGSFGAARVAALRSHQGTTRSSNSNDLRQKESAQNIVFLAQRNNTRHSNRMTSLAMKPPTTASIFTLSRGWNRSRRIHQLLDGEENEKVISQYIIRWSPQAKAIMTAVEKVEKLSKLLVQLARKMSSRSMKNFRALKLSLKKIVQSFDLTRNNSEITVSKSNESQFSKGPGIKRSAHGSSFLCPSEFVGGGSWASCYKLSTWKSNWYEARSYCTSMDADLLSMETLKEAYIIDYIIKSYGTKYQTDSRSGNKQQNRQASQDYKNLPHHQTHRTGKEDFQYWTSAVSGKDNLWRWTSRTRTKPITYSRWLSHKPDSGFSRYCMIIQGNIGFTWDNVNCYDEHQFICEIDIY